MANFAYPVSYTHLDVYKRQLLDSAKENLNVANYFSLRAAQTGSPAYREYCLKWVNVFQQKVDFYQNSAIDAHAKIEMFVSDINTKIDANIGFFGKGATGRKILPFLDKALTVADLSTAIVTRDWGKVSGVVIGYLVGEAVASIAAIVLAGAALPATATVLLVATIGGLAGVAAGEASESIFDGAFGTPQDELLSERISRLLSDGISLRPVSYTHLDVYKRQHSNKCGFSFCCSIASWSANNAWAIAIRANSNNAFC